MSWRSAPYIFKARLSCTPRYDVPLVPLSTFPSWRGCITNTSGYDFRKGAAVLWLTLLSLMAIMVRSQRTDKRQDARLLVNMIGWH